MHRQETAETMALRALSWLAGNEELLPVFLGSTGASLGDLATGARDPAFLGAVLDFILMDDVWVVACCETIAVPFDSLIQARAALPGGAEMHWT